MSRARTSSSASTSARMRPMSRASQLAALVRRLAGRRARARRVRRAGRQDADAARRGDRGRAASRPRAGAGEETSARTCASSPPTLRELDESGFDRALVDAPCSGLGVLARRPDLRWRARPLPELQLELLQAAAERTKPGGTIVYSVCTLNADENEAVVDALGLDVEPLGDEWPQYAHPTRPEFLLTLPDRDRTSGLLHRPPAQAVGSPRCPGGDWIRTVEVEPSLYGADFAQPRRADRGAAARRLPRLPLRRRRRALRRAGHDRADRARVDLAADPPLRRRDRRAPDGREPGEVLRAGRGGRRRQRHVPLRGGRRRRRDDPRRARARAAGRGRVQPGDRARGRSPRSRGDADLVLCMAIHPGYSGQQFRDATYDRVRRLRARAARATSTSRSTAASAPRTSSSCATCGATLLVAGDVDLRARRSRRAPTAARAAASRERSHARSSSRGARSDRAYPKPTVGAVRRRATARSSAKARPRPAAATPRSSRSRRPASARAARRCT